MKWGRGNIALTSRDSRSRPTESCRQWIFRSQDHTWYKSHERVRVVPIPHVSLVLGTARLLVESSNVIIADQDAPDAVFAASIRIRTVLSCLTNDLPPSTDGKLPSHCR